MGKIYPALNGSLVSWIQKQQLFFVSTAPLSAEGRVNCSPKGLDSFRIIDEQTVAYLDLTGSGVETIAHLKENGRITILFCALEGAPKILRLYGRGVAYEVGSVAYEERKALFPVYPGVRSIIEIKLEHIADSCGFGIPVYEYKEQRDTLIKWAEHKGEEGISKYQQERNGESIDGLPGVDKS